MEVREGATCNRPVIGCNDNLDGDNTKTGFNSIQLTGGTTYVIMVTPYYASGEFMGTVQLEVGLYTLMPITRSPTRLPTLLPAHSPTPPTTLAPISSPTHFCLDNDLVASTERGWGKWELRSNNNDIFQYPTQLSCSSPNASLGAQYFSFVPPTSDDYYLRVRYSGAKELVVEVRSHVCDGHNLGCGVFLLDYSAKLIARSGITSLRITERERYVILVTRKGGLLPISYNHSYVVEVRLTSSSSGDASANSAYLATLSSSLFLPILLPGCFFAPALLLALALCKRDGRSNLNQQGVTVYYGSCSCSLAAVRQLAIALWILPLLVLVTTWSVTLNLPVYMTAAIMFMFGVLIHCAANSPSFLQTDFSVQADQFNLILSLLGILFVIFAILASIMDTARLLSPRFMGVCDERFSGNVYNEANHTLCINLHLVYPIYSIIAIVSMLLAALVAITLRNVLQRLVATFNIATMSDVKAMQDWQEEEQQRRYEERRRQSEGFSRQVSDSGGAMT